MTTYCQGQWRVPGPAVRYSEQREYPYITGLGGVGLGYVDGFLSAKGNSAKDTADLVLEG